MSCSLYKCATPSNKSACCFFRSVSPVMEFYENPLICLKEIERIMPTEIKSPSLDETSSTACSETEYLEWPEPCIPTPKEFNHSKVDYLKLLLTAKVYDGAIETPLLFAPKASKELGSRMYLKREDLQPVFSFKCRGAFNKIASLSQEEREAGVICASAGNHAQGVALAAQRLGLKATIVMPIFCPSIKVDNVKRMGAKVVLFGNSFDEAKEECKRLQEEEGLTYIPPFDGIAYPS